MQSLKDAQDAAFVPAIVKPRSDVVAETSNQTQSQDKQSRQETAILIRSTLFFLFEAQRQKPMASPTLTLLVCVLAGGIAQYLEEWLLSLSMRFWTWFLQILSAWRNRIVANLIARSQAKIQSQLGPDPVPSPTTVP
ncbi:MAG: hypothetical protein ABSG59_23525 [Verrucomicrobiota bacterium]|jgi:hypothetical protein